MFEVLDDDNLAAELERLVNADEIADKMLSAAAPILERELRGQVHQAANKGYATGNLAASITANKPKKNNLGHYVSVQAKGKNKKGVRNNEELAYLNYGTSKQEARPVIHRAVKNAEKPCIGAMQDKFNEVTDG